ncbi:MAG: GGDEF domain-containing protein, partial [Actinomycetia bacterium]|nr:GGDEF domain-containing protein [Actinomycetes bacterium]
MGPGHRVFTPVALATAGAVLGLMLTFAIAAMEQAGAKQERQMTFGREAEAIQQQLIAQVGELSTTFDSTMSFIGATHPTSPETYADYLERQVPLRADLDPGVFLVEEVDRSQLDALIRREHDFGNTDFEVITFDLYPDFAPALVVTRAGRGSDGKPFPYVGYDILAGQQILLPESFPDNGYVLRVTESSLILSSTIMSGGDLALTSLEGEIPEISPFFVGGVHDSNGHHIGWAIQFVNTEALTDGTAIPDQFNVQMSVENIDEPIVALPGTSEPKPESTEFYEQRQIVTASQRWSLEVWADPEFGRSASLLAQTQVLAIGVAISSTLALAGGAWAYFRRRLAGASFELEYARTLATTDHLTGLLNRQGLIDAARQRPRDEEATLFFVDLDGFK